MSPIPVEITESFVHRDGQVIHLRLALPGTHLAEPVRVSFRSRGRRFTQAARLSSAGEGVVLDLDIPHEQWGRGVWRMLAWTPDQEAPLPVQARVQLHPRLPVALLPGPEPKPRMPEPEPPLLPAPSRRRKALRLVRRGASKARRTLARARHHLPSRPSAP